MFRRILIANRGEIAVRIAATLQQMGIRSVGVYSDVDRAALHVACMDEAYPLEGSTATDTYLRGDKIIDIAKSQGVDAIHPGYGFLSENAAFAEACRDSGVAFIGPSPETIRALGDKINAKRVLESKGVPVIPGWAGSAADGSDRLAREAAKIGYPLMIKAAAGGGGKGMRLVSQERDRPAALEAAAREAGAAFGDGRVFLEKYIPHARHVEFQIFGDAHGNVLHLFERECSIQRRHQKIVEETPSPSLTPELRRRMGESAVRVAQAFKYTNAGTVEFLVDSEGAFYFLEVNTRLQVEHPVTEMTTGLDLVRAQILVAAGEPLPFMQDEVTPFGHAVECRIYAEDAGQGFLPSTGRIECYVPPSGPNIRVDSGVAQGSDITVHYDPMLAKLITWGRTRTDALNRMTWALDRFVVLGVTTNIEFLQSLIAHPEFQAGRVHTEFLDAHLIKARRDGTIPDEVLIAAALAGKHPSRRAQAIGVAPSLASSTSDGPWHTAGAWRGI